MKKVYEQGDYAVIYKGITGSGFASPTMKMSYLHTYILLKKGNTIKYYNTSNVIGTGPLDKKSQQKAIDTLKHFIP